MQRLFRFTFLAALITLFCFSESKAQIKPFVYVSGRIAPGDVRIFLKDSIYRIDHQLVIGGTLIIEPGTEIQFFPDGRIIDSVGGRIISDGDAFANYNANPNGYNPIAAPGSAQNPLSWTGYADLNYLLYPGTITVGTTRDRTVHTSKYDHIFNVALDTARRRLVNLVNPGTTTPGLVTIPFETALVFSAARLFQNPQQDVNLNIRPWARFGAKDVDIEDGTIRFVGQATTTISREWGHIIVLPGARAAFFRNTTFEGFKKDTTVDRRPIYGSMPGADVNQLNRTFNLLTNGSGGAITTFSARTWLLNVGFRNNTARYKGGALMLLQAPAGFPTANIAAAGTYPADKNPNITDRDGSISDIIQQNPIPRIDRIDEAAAEPISDFDRQAYDDGRLALYLGRMRNLNFENNKVQLANVVVRRIGGINVVMDDIENPATYPQTFGNFAYGGALYMEGRAGDDNRMIEVGLGVNHSINMDNTLVRFPNEDSFIARTNNANNFQNGASTFGARGGAVYTGDYTSLIAAGLYRGNQTYARFLQDDLTGSNSGNFSMGGAIFAENTLARLQIRGGQLRNNIRPLSPFRTEPIGNATEFDLNRSGSGGAVYTDGNTSPWASPVVGGSDATLITRDYGYNIFFHNNTAISYGGAIFSKRNMFINGAGGVESGNLLGYGGENWVRLWNNKAGYAGGGLEIAVPAATAHPQRLVQIIRASFRENIVGENIAELNRRDIMGGGAIMALYADLNLIKGTEFVDNFVWNGNGGAIQMVNPDISGKRFFLTDLDQVTYDGAGFATEYTSFNGPFVWADNVTYPADTRMLTIFKGNMVELDSLTMATQMGSGVTQVANGVLPPNDELHNTVWVNDNTGYAVGYNGTIIRFNNGGTTWNFQTSGTRYRLMDVDFNGGDLIVVGDRGIILRSNNGGTTWTPVTSTIDKRINDVDYVGSTVFAVADEGFILKSVDNGATWTATQPQMTDLYSVYFADQNNGIAVGDRGVILRTTNGGVNWNTVNVSGVISALNKVSFFNTTNGFIVGDNGTLLVTNNGGSSWNIVNTGTTVDLYNVQFTDASTGYISGQYGTILRTNNGGAAWTTLTTNVSNDLFGLFFSSASRGVAVGDYGMVIQTVNNGTTWTKVQAQNSGYSNVVRYHPKARIPENGVGLGGAIYVLDSITTNRVNRSDSISLNRVRIQDNHAFTGSAIYSDNYDLKFIVNRSMITSNHAYSEIGVEQNLVIGPVELNVEGDIIGNEASSDLASATIYGEIQGPLPSFLFPEAGNSIYNNNARFIVRLPDAPNTKGILAGSSGQGSGGTDTLRGNYWGYTDANVYVEYNILDTTHGSSVNPTQETFFIATDPDTTYLRFIFNDQSNPLHQGPFESLYLYTYTPIPIGNDPTDENKIGVGTLPDTLLMSGHVYDIFDKGTDIKTADYSRRRQSPIEDFAVGIPPFLRRYTDNNLPSNGKYVRRWIRDPFVLDRIDENGDTLFPFWRQLLDEFRPTRTGEFVHPIGYPLFLEARADYTGLVERSNFDETTLNETVFFVINETTGDFIRTNLRQVSETAPYADIFRSRVEFVPDSSNRSPNTLLRRTTEGLLNLGTGDFLLRQLEDNPYNEEGAVLGGRRYHAPYDALGGVGANLFSNRMTMPESNEGFATFWAGERYSALPVNVGDNIRVISRTILWKEGVVEAYDDGLSFRIVYSFEPPIFTGNIYELQNQIDTVFVPSKDPRKNQAGILDTIIYDFRGMLFVTEDREYPQPPGTYSLPANRYDRGRDSIISITAMDTNSLFDPRSILFPDEYTNLTYTWSVDANSGLFHWLQADTIFAGDQTVPNPRDNAAGYMVLRGKPTNPYVVPGGEYVTVRAMNYPPSWRTIDSLRRIGVPQETLDVFIEIFRPYLSQPVYDTENARYLQQDTINVGGRFAEETYRFRIFVVDSIPKFFGTDGADEPKLRVNRAGDVLDTIVVYEPSVYKCGETEDGRVIATLAGRDASTKKLRFQIDLNTDDEAEDKWAAPSWNFRYGRTAYGFLNTIISGIPDTVVIDTVVVVDEFGQIDSLLSQERPDWLQTQYLQRYDQEGTADPFGMDFLLNGQINVRIPNDEAVALLARPGDPGSNWNQLNTDTTFTVVVNDGHGGLNKLTLPVFINAQPRILTQSLARAKEGVDYNFREGQNLIDSARIDNSRGILIEDINFGQTHKFELIKAGYGNNQIPVDPCFTEAGAWDVTNLKVTPEWLYINETSGILYGTPQVTDAPKTEQVVVLVTDENGLTDLKVYDLFVDSTNHGPRVVGYPEVRCIEQGKAYLDTLIVIDYDLLRTNEPEQLTLTVLQPSGLEIVPSTINGPNNDSVKVVIRGSAFNAPVDQDGRVTVRVQVSDGEEDYVFEYKLKLSEPTYFTSTIKIENSIGAYELLTWGTASNIYDVTTGDGSDGAPRGSLDENFCEYELPPAPNEDVFDARWDIPLTNGTDRNIYPGNIDRNLIYKGFFQAGGVQGGFPTNYPVTLTWNADEIPDRTDNTRNPQGSTWYLRDCFSNGDRFSVNMKTGESRIQPGVAEVEVNGSEISLTIIQSTFECFVIFMDTFSPVDANNGIVNTEITSVSPNPLTDRAVIEFTIAQAGEVKLEVVDLLGNVVMTLDNSQYNAGTYKLNWNGVDAAGRPLASGSYTVRLSAGTVTSTAPVVIAR